MARTDNLTNFLTDVATSIKEKKGDNTLIQASDFDTEITNLPSGGDVSEYFTENLSYSNSLGSNQGMFLLSMKKIPPFYFNGTIANQLFTSCMVESLDLSNFNTSNTTSMFSLFEKCKKIISLDLSNFNTSKVTNMGFMFSECSKLKHLDLSNFDVSKVTTMRYMFNSCSSLESLNLSNWNTSKVTDMLNTFYSCSNLKKIIINSSIILKLATANVFSSTPIASGTGYVYVPDDLVESYKTATNWSVYASQIKPISELPEEVEE